jgi:glucan phosphorylase
MMSSLSLMDKYFSHYHPLLGLNRDAFLQLGISPKELTAGFNATAFALRMSAYRNGVSKRHGEVARHVAVSLAWRKRRMRRLIILPTESMCPAGLSRR